MIIVQPVRFCQELQLLIYIICEQVVEDSSEIFSVKVSASYRKSLKRTKVKNKPQPVFIRINSLSKISEENTDDNYNSEALKVKLENKVNGCHVTFVCDDEKVTSDTSDSSNNNRGNISHKKENNQSSTGTVILNQKRKMVVKTNCGMKRTI